MTNSIQEARESLIENIRKMRLAARAATPDELPEKQKAGLIAFYDAVEDFVFRTVGIEDSSRHCSLALANIMNIVQIFITGNTPALSFMTLIGFLLVNLPRESLESGKRQLMEKIIEKLNEGG